MVEENRVDGLGLSDKSVIVFGVSDESSIGWAIAKSFLDQGARVTIGYQQQFYSRVRLLLLKHPEVVGARCDLLNKEELDAFFASYEPDSIDVLVHSIAFGAPNIFTADPSDTTAEDYEQMMSISSHSLCTVVRYAKPLLKEWGSVMTLTYQASESATPFYGMMGVAKSALEGIVRLLAIELGSQKVRVNAISPGPIETPAALGETLALMRDRSALQRKRGDLLKRMITDAEAEAESQGYNEIEIAQAACRNLQKVYASHCAIEEVVTAQDVADCALFLGSDLSRKISGQVIHIDCGLSSKELWVLPQTGQ